LLRALRVVVGAEVAVTVLAPLLVPRTPGVASDPDPVSVAVCVEGQCVAESSSVVVTATETGSGSEATPGVRGTSRSLAAVPAALCLAEVNSARARACRCCDLAAPHRGYRNGIRIRSHARRARDEQWGKHRNSNLGPNHHRRIHGRRGATARTHQRYCR
jgi:hypothetical protein